MPTRAAAGAAKGSWETDQGRGEARARQSDAARRAGRSRRRAGGAARPRPRREAAAKASTVGFDWNDPKAVLAKLREEIDEIEAEIDRRRDADRVAGRARRPPVRRRQPRPAPRRSIPSRRCAATNAKFVRRFGCDRGGAGGGRAHARATPASTRWKRSGRRRRANAGDADVARWAVGSCRDCAPGNAVRNASESRSARHADTARRSRRPRSSCASTTSPSS